MRQHVVTRRKLGLLRVEERNSEKKKGSLAKRENWREENGANEHRNATADQPKSGITQ